MKDAYEALERLENAIGKGGMENFIGKGPADLIREACGAEVEEEAPVKAPVKAPAAKTKKT